MSGDGLSIEDVAALHLSPSPWDCTERGHVPLPGAGCLNCGAPTLPDRCHHSVSYRETCYECLGPLPIDGAL
jgi:hypothetical protein